ncbi:unnamed protein product [Menidia menidia]|uniref:(Atlantic silverside) hypothetical protein n=1 Tax=Menidia menidia TaxID=238744 RepID=A0A8S4BJN8_9TELE|nr:unnamed protein product [Menidia menidia]
MGCSWLLVLGLVLKVSHCLGIQGSGAEPISVISHNITAVLGEDVHLSCSYLGDSEITASEWRRQINSKNKFRRLAGFSNGKFFHQRDFSIPESPTNLTTRMRVSSVEAEGEYFCQFESEDEIFLDTVFVTVVARPEIQVQINAETLNGTHYQYVTCSAGGGRPAPHISWLIGRHPPSDPPFTVDVNETLHSDGTSTLTSVLRFPTQQQDEDTAACVVKHPTLPNPKLSAVRVETYARPNVTIKAEVVQQGGNDSWVVSCISSGGRPDTDISLALNVSEELQREYDKDSDAQTLSVRLPVAEYEGHIITCMFNHPKFTHTESRLITLPTFYLMGAQLHSEMGSENDDFRETEFLELQEGERDVVRRIEVAGNVPRYNTICKKDDGALPEDVALVGESLTFGGPVELHHAGLYVCDISYQHLRTWVQLNVTVRPPAQRLVPPRIRLDLRREDGRRVIECAAADAVPAANVSWLQPEGVSADFWFSSTTHNGSHSVRGVLLLPACSQWELTAVCVINHPAFEEAVNRSITFPICAPPNITLSASSEWKDGQKHTKVLCSAVSVSSAADISWHAGNESIGSLMEAEVQAEGLVLSWNSVHFLSSLYAGQNLTCMVKHPSLKTPETRTIHIPAHKAPWLSVSVARQQDSPIWLAVCDCRGEGVGTNLAWVLPQNARGETSLHTEYEGHIMNARLIYRFPLALHEGQELTCVYKFESGIAEKKSITIPRYYMSSLRVLNQTTPLHSRFDDQPVIHRLSVHENHRSQKILLKVEGNVPDHSIDCRRSDGLIVQMDGDAMILQPEVSGQNTGLYTCLASFCHHKATVNIQVEVMSEDEQLMLVTMICVSSSVAILLVFIVTLCVCCKRNSRQQYKKRESLSALAALMQEPGSPEVKKPPAASDDSKELVTYSIVIDIKSTV